MFSFKEIGFCVCSAAADVVAAAVVVAKNRVWIGIGETESKKCRDSQRTTKVWKEAESDRKKKEAERGGRFKTDQQRQKEDSERDSWKTENNKEIEDSEQQRFRRRQRKKLSNTERFKREQQRKLELRNR